jgi:hypothetical protein
MTNLSKRYKALMGTVDRAKLYPIGDAIKIVKDNATAKFNESIDVAINLGIDAKKSDQTVRGSVVLPSGTGKIVRVAVFAQGDKAQAAKDAGADLVGLDDLAAEIKGGKMDFDVVIATPDTRTARPDAQPEGRHRHAGCRRRGEKREGGPGSISRRQDRHRAMHDRTRVIQCRCARRESESIARRSEQIQAIGNQRYLSQKGVGLEHDGGRRTRRPGEYAGLKNW